MQIAEARAGTFERGDDGRFRGEVWLRGTLTAADGTNVGIVHFSPGARTHWHRHPNGTLRADRDRTPTVVQPLGGTRTERWTYLCACGDVYLWERRE